MRDLLARGLVAPGTLRLGLQATPDGCAIGPSGKAQDRLRIVGPLRKADLWESTAVPELRVQAADAVDSILRDLLTQTRPATLDQTSRRPVAVPYELKGDTR